MKSTRNTVFGPGLAAVGLLALASLAGAQQPFVYNDSDLCLTFRMVPDDNNEVVVNLGQASTYVNAPIGTHIPITAFSPSQLASPTFSSLDNLHWAVFGWYISGTGYPGYPACTLWVTVPRSDSNVRSADAVRHSAASQLNTQDPMATILYNAAFVSKAMGTASDYNNATFVRESVADYSTHLQELWMESRANTTLGTLNDTWRDNNLENATYLGFEGSGDVVRSDLYEVRPLDDGHGGTVVDPHTGTSGLAYYVGYFELASDGSMTFVRESASTAPNPPPPPTLSITRAGNVNTISFVSSNSATYTLCYTNAAGLSAPVSNWPSLPDALTGNGTMQSFQDTTTDPMRFYSVRGQ